MGPICHWVIAEAGWCAHTHIAETPTAEPSSASSAYSMQEGGRGVRRLAADGVAGRLAAGSSEQRR